MKQHRKHLKMSKYSAMNTDSIKEKIERLRSAGSPSYKQMMAYMELLTELEVRGISNLGQPTNV